MMSEFRFMVPKSKIFYSNETSSAKLNFSMINQEFDFVRSPSVLENVLIIWILSFIFEEFRQVYIFYLI
jgi:hypothetical protein